MSTRRIYHEDTTALAAEAVLLRQDPAGDRWAVVLDRTVIFPGGGGQPPDTGWLDECRVVDMAEEGEEIVHFLATALPGRSAGDTVKVRVDAARRREASQQHTGQHIISACLLRAGDYQTVSVHMGDDAMTIESPVPTIPEEALRAAEACANATICRNLPVRTHVVRGDELGRFSLRRAAAPRELYRIVEIEGHDASACGGVHVLRSGEVGLVKCMGTETIRGHCRSIWLVGDRAYRDYARTTEIARQLGAELSVPPEELPDAVRKLKAEVADLREKVDGLERAVATAEAERMSSGGERCRDATLVIRRLDGCAASSFRALGMALARRPATVALLAAVEGTSARLFASCGAGAAVDLAAALAPHLGMIRGKGGGRGGVWQGAAQDASRIDGFLSAAGRALREASGGA